MKPFKNNKLNIHSIIKAKNILVIFDQSLINKIGNIENKKT